MLFGSMAKEKKNGKKVQSIQNFVTKWISHGSADIYLFGDKSKDIPNNKEENQHQ